VSDTVPGDMTAKGVGHASPRSRPRRPVSRPRGRAKPGAGDPGEPVPLVPLDTSPLGRLFGTFYLLRALVRFLTIALIWQRIAVLAFPFWLVVGLSASPSIGSPAALAIGVVGWLATITLARQVFLPGRGTRH
jgi:hypothetical protein